MKYSVVKFKNLETCLKELEPFIRDGKHLLTGKKFKRFGGLRSRELLANWLLCVILNFEDKSKRFIFTSDPLGGDGIIYNDYTKQSWPTEHVLAYSHEDSLQNTNESIINAIKNKQKKGGKAYASGKTLIVFVYITGRWFPKEIAMQHQLKAQDFDSVWVVGLSNYIELLDMYAYNVVKINMEEGVPIWRVYLEKDFNKWNIERIQ
jgi:hypothetical protein